MKLLIEFTVLEKLRPRHYFIILDITLTYVKLATFFSIVWKRSILEDMLNTGHAVFQRFGEGAMRGFRFKCIIYFVFYVASSFSLFFLIVLLKFPNKSAWNSLKIFYSTATERGQQRFGFSHVTPYAHGNSVLWLVIELTIVYSKFVISAIVDVFYLVGVPSLLSEPVAEFQLVVDYVLNTPGISFPRQIQVIQKAFGNLCLFSKVVNSIWAKAVLNWAVGKCMFNIYLLNMVGLTNNASYFFVIVASFSLWGNSLISYANIQRQVKFTLYKFLSYQL